MLPGLYYPYVQCTVYSVHPLQILLLYVCYQLCTILLYSVQCVLILNTFTICHQVCIILLYSVQCTLVKHTPIIYVYDTRCVLFPNVQCVRVVHTYLTYFYYMLPGVYYPFFHQDSYLGT